MSENNVNGIYEIMQTMKDQTTIQNDMNEVGTYMKNMLMDKYMSNIQKIIAGHRQATQKNPPKEVKLLASLKPFMSNESHSAIDKLIDGFMMMETYKGLSGEFQTASINMYDNTLKDADEIDSSDIVQSAEVTRTIISDDESIHNDGVYDIDKACMLKKNNLNSNNNMFGLLIAVCAFMNKS